MKKVFNLLLIISFVISLAGCQKEDNVSLQDVQKKHFVLKANMPKTKTGISYSAGSYTPYWNTNDELGVIFTLPSSTDDLNNDAVFKNTNSSGTTAAFEGDVSIEDGEGITFYSYYPASSGKKVYVKNNEITFGLDIPSTQTPLKNSTNGYTFDPSADLLIAKPASCIVDGGTGSNEVDMYFARISSVLRIELNSLASTEFYGEVVKSFKIETSSGDLAGRVEVNPTSGEYSKTNSITGSKAVTAIYDISSCPVYIGTSNANNVFLSVAPITIPSGSSLTFTIKTADASTGEIKHTLVKTVSKTPADIIFESSKPTVIKLSLSDDNIPSSTVEYTLVKNTADLTIGSEVIIAATDFDKALGSQTANNRAAVTQEKSTDNQTITGPAEGVQILTIVEGNKNNTVAFSTGSGYLCAASSGSNYLRTESTLSDNSSWSIDINSESGIASVVAQGTYTRNTMQYNSTNDLFACYASASQKSIAIYKRSTPDTRLDVTLSFSTASYDLSIGTSEYAAFKGQAVNTTPSGVVGIKYALTGDLVGSVNENTGEVTLNGNTAGTATITASFAGDEEFKPATSVSYTINVDDPNVVDYVTLDWTYPEINTDATKAGISAIAGVTAVGLGDDYGSSHSPYRIKLDSNGDYIQVKTDVAIGEVTVGYKMIGGSSSSTLNILESSDGENFTSVEDLVISGSQNDIGVVTSSNAFKSTSRYVKINFTKGSNIGVGLITISKADTTPRFTVEGPLSPSVSGGSFTVNITRKYFDGAITVTVPSGCSWITASNVASNANSFNITVSANSGEARSATLTLSASGVESKTLVVNQAGHEPGTESNPYTVAQALTEAGKLDQGDTSSEDVYVSGVISSVETYFSNFKSITYYISDDGTTSSQLEVYSGKGLNGANFTDITNLAVGDEVIVKGKLKNYNGTLEINQSSQIVNISYTTRYSVNLLEVTNGVISSSSTSVGAQGIVTLTATPASGYELDKWTVINKSTNAAINVDSEGKFIMPASDVDVSATFTASASTETTVTFTAADFSGQGTANTGSAVSCTINGVKVSTDKGFGTSEFRVYASGSFNIECTEANKKIKSISFTFSGGKTGGLDSSYNYTEAPKQSVSFGQLASQARFSQIIVIYE